MNFTVNGVRYRSHNGVFPVKRRFGTDAVLVHLRSSPKLQNNSVETKNNTQHELQSRKQTTQHTLTQSYNNSCANNGEDSNAQHVFHVCAMDRRGYALITDGGEYEVRSFEVNQNANPSVSTAITKASTSCHRWAKRESRKRMSMKLGSQAMTYTTNVKEYNNSNKLDETQNNEESEKIDSVVDRNKCLDDENVPLSLQFSINSITRERKFRRKPGKYVHFIGQFLTTFAGTAFRDASRQWQTFTAQEKATKNVQELIEKVAVSGQYQRRVIS